MKLMNISRNFDENVISRVRQEKLLSCRCNLLGLSLQQSAKIRFLFGCSRQQTGDPLGKKGLLEKDIPLEQKKKNLSDYISVSFNCARKRSEAVAQGSQLNGKEYSEEDLLEDLRLMVSTGPI